MKYCELRGTTKILIYLLLYKNNRSILLDRNRKRIDLHTTAAHLSRDVKSYIHSAPYVLIRSGCNMAASEARMQIFPNHYLSSATIISNGLPNRQQYAAFRIQVCNAASSKSRHVVGIYRNLSLDNFRVYLFGGTLPMEAVPKAHTHTYIDIPDGPEERTEAANNGVGVGDKESQDRRGECNLQNRSWL